MSKRDSLDLKIVVLGPAGVGKTCIINRYCNGSFQTDTMSTIGAGFFTHTLIIDHTDVTLMLWDTAGEERFQSVAPSLLRGASGVILTFDLTKFDSFQGIDTYMEMFLNTCQIPSGIDYPVLLLGNKSDLEERVIGNDLVEDWKKRNNVSLYYEVSAKTGSNINEAFETFLKRFVIPVENSKSIPIQIILDPNVSNNSQNRCC
ncbi:small GTP-binding protein [Tritrichomonas foetus]|uniref:Small GTP-binding protein n=1 Tax=Tritrichomonas foetus TaxID=1144522 RepID=A0A1J4JKE6_9EUKA|nr:small GTP-binding protein [Tritrichomonas foetus]|eukprot:OHS99089.1 small GTP-binding protein [Tritrichomonas foetus]